MQKIAYLLISLIAIGYILIIADNIIIPLILALLIWFIVKDIRELLNRIPFIKNRVPSFIQNSLVFLLFFGVMAVISNMLIANIESFRLEIPTYQRNLVDINSSILNRFNFDVSKKHKRFFR